MTGRRPFALFACLTLAAIVAVFDPAVTWWFPSCPFYALTGWLCPLCGSLRAVHALLHGAPRAAWGFNPLTTAAVAAGGVALLLDALRPEQPARAGRLIGFCLSGRALAAASAFGVLRNLTGPIGRIFF